MKAVYQLVRDRKQAKKDHGKGSLEELILKTMVNSGYGKTAQNVIQKNTWTAFKDEMEDIGCSSITNPVSAAMITSIVRTELLSNYEMTQYYMSLHMLAIFPTTSQDTIIQV